MDYLENVSEDWSNEVCQWNRPSTNYAIERSTFQLNSYSAVVETRQSFNYFDQEEGTSDFYSSDTISIYAQSILRNIRFDLPPPPISFTNREVLGTFEDTIEDIEAVYNWLDQNTQTIQNYIDNENPLNVIQEHIDIITNLLYTENNVFDAIKVQQLKNKRKALQTIWKFLDDQESHLNHYLLKVKTNKLNSATSALDDLSIKSDECLNHGRALRGTNSMENEDANHNIYANELKYYELEEEAEPISNRGYSIRMARVTPNNYI